MEESMMEMTPEKWQRYLDGQSSDEERKEILLYFQSLSPGMWEKIVADDWNEAPPPMPVAAAGRMDDYIASLMETNASGKRKAARKWLYWAAACSVLLAIGISFLWLPGRQSRSVADSVPYEDFFNAGKLVQKINLPDSSVVWLAPRSLLKVNSGYPAEGRDISLEGEAYFEVAHSDTQPFVVHAGKVQTTVHGTHFNIEAYHAEANTRVSLSEGSVSVKMERNGIGDTAVFLQPGNRLVYQPGQQLFYTETFSKETEADWKSGALVLNDLPVETVFKRLEQRFGKTIRYNINLIKDKRFTATFHHADFGLILQNIAFVQGLRFTEVADTVFIHSYK